MKSIVEEASSIFKAIEAAWIRADKPSEFSVKVFEEPEKNFFGMVTKSAKIALLFKEDDKKARSKEQRQPRKQAPRAPEEKPAPQVVKEKTAKPAPAPKERVQKTTTEPSTKERVFWTDEMIESTRSWLNTLLANLACQNVQFQLEPKRYYLTVSFDKPVRETKEKEQLLFRSCAYIIMQMLRTKMKKQLRGLKVVLKSPA